jgi:anti-sigma B factor antagonist
MRLSVDQFDDVTIVRVGDAKLTYPVLWPFFTGVREVVEGGGSKVVIDMEAVTIVDSPAIGCLMEIHRLLEDRKGALKLSGLQPRVARMLSMAGLGSILGVHPRQAEALADLRGVAGRA